MQVIEKNIVTDFNGIKALIENVRETVHLVRLPENRGFGLIPNIEQQQLMTLIQQQQLTYVSAVAPVYPEYLGDKHFLAVHGTRFPYVIGAMANGITTAEMVIVAAQSGMLGFFGAAGLLSDEIEKNIDKIQQALPDNQINWGANLIHNPQEPSVEESVVELYLRRNVHRISASAYMSLTPYVVRYACKGLYLDTQGHVQRKNYVFAKISRPETARLFMSPAPVAMLTKLVEQGHLTPQEAELAQRVPLAEDITAESDSGGHTDNRPLSVLFPMIQQLAQQLSAQYGYQTPIRIGAAGGLGVPAAVAGAFSLGAAYVLTGTVNEAAVESGLSEAGKQLLAQADMADVCMAPAADMFEIGVELQVLKRGTLFSSKAKKLYAYYCQYNSLDELPQKDQDYLEKQIFQQPISDVWKTTREYFLKRDKNQVERADRDEKHRMALVFRWYLGFSSRWAITGEASRQIDYQIWCGPAMGAFNAWVKGTFLEALQQRTVRQIGLNLLEGAAVISRAQILRSYGMALPMQAFAFQPRKFS